MYPKRHFMFFINWKTKFKFFCSNFLFIAIGTTKFKQFSTYFMFKGTLSGLSQFLVAENLSKKMKNGFHFVATKIANHPKPTDTTWSHLKPFANTQDHPKPPKAITPKPSKIPQKHPLSPEATFNQSETSCSWSGTVHIHLKTPRYYQYYSKTVKEMLVKTSYFF